MDFPLHPTINATLNAISFVLLMFGYAAIKRGDKETHKKFMLSAGVTTVIFLVSYLTYHFTAGHVKFKGTGTIAYIYGTILLTHVVLAIVVAVLAPITFTHAFKERWEKHKAIAKITFPMWVYVCVTGIIVYVMVYHMYK
ncbi:MAG: DUF420 domain-containing protein [Planctomycetota bacterium]